MTSDVYFSLPNLLTYPYQARSLSALNILTYRLQARSLSVLFEDAMANEEMEEASA